MAPVTFSVGTASAPVSPSLQDTTKDGFFENPNPAVVSVPESASNPNIPALNAHDGLPVMEHHADGTIKQADFATREHHHHHHHNGPAAIPINPYARAMPSYSLAASHAYEPGSINADPYGLPRGTRRAGQRQVQGLGRAMPTWEEMQLRKALKAERNARHQEHLARKSAGHSHTHTPKDPNRSMTSLVAVPPTGDSHDIQQAMTEMYAAMRHLTSLLPEGYAHSGTATPYTLTPAVSRSYTNGPKGMHEMNGINGNGNGYPDGKDGKDGKDGTAASHHSDASSCSSSSSSDDDDEETIKPNPIARFRHFIREPAAEFLGTALLLLFGNGVNNQFFLSQDPNVDSTVRGTYTSVSFSWGIGVMVGVYVSGGISGGHLNPAVTLTLAVFRKFPWKKVIPFWVAQVLGAMTGSALVSLLYERAVTIYEGGPGIRTVVGDTATAGLYTTFPLAYMSVAASFFNEFLDTAILLCVIFALGDSNNTPPPDGLNPIVLLFLIFGIGASLGSQTAYAINPARDFGPRLMLWCRGYGTELWTVNSWYWITTPILATLSGGLVGGLVYDLLIYTGSESPLNSTWEFRWSRRHKLKTLHRTGAQPGAVPQENEKMPAGGQRQDHSNSV